MAPPAAVVPITGAELSLADVAARNPGRDIILTMPGAMLPFAWEERLRKAAYAATNVAAAVPLCDVGPLFALVDEDLRAQSRTDAQRIDRTAYAMGNRTYYEVPRIHPVCAYLRRDALDAALPFLPAGALAPQAALDALAQRWSATGLASVLLDYLYVGNAGDAPVAGAAAPGFEERAFLQHHPLGGLRRAVNDAIRAGLPPVTTPGLDARPVLLHIMHFWGGGLDRWVRDFGRADSGAVNMILASYRIGEQGGQRLVLYSDPAAMIPIRVWDIARAIRSTASSSLEYRRILDQVVREFDVEAIVVSSLIGHALEALAQPVKTIVVCHDFYPICQAINPLFVRTCERCTLEDLRLCAKGNPLNNIFVDRSSEEWHELRRLYVDRVIENKVEMVVPSGWVAGELRKLEPRLEAVPMHVVPHGIDFDAAKLPVAPRKASEKIRLVVLGRLSLQKGTGLLRQAAGQLRPIAEVTLVGGGKNGMKLAEECGWQCIERYELDALPGVLASIAPHAGLLASVVPETFSYTLSELWTLGIPPLATSLGSFRERIDDGGTGFLFEPEADALVALVKRLHGQPELLEGVARRVAALPRHRSTAQMLAGYRALIPLAERPVARFAVGPGVQTALTEPYRHLTEAYASLTGAYDQTREAYERAREELGPYKGTWDQWKGEFDALQVRTRWWLAPKAARLVFQLPARFSNAIRRTKRD